MALLIADWLGVSMMSQGLAQVLMEYREQNKSLQFEVDDLKQKLQDAQGDIKVPKSSHTVE